MDHFGIGTAVEGAARMYFQGARRSGRTTSMLDSLKDGDRIWFADAREANRVERLCKERGLTVECRTLSVRGLDSVRGAFECGTPKGRTLFDHSWVEQFYMAAIQNAQAAIDHTQRETSGWGAAHLDTRRRAVEIAQFKGTFDSFGREDGAHA